ERREDGARGLRREYVMAHGRDSSRSGSVHEGGTGGCAVQFPARTPGRVTTVVSIPPPCGHTMLVPSPVLTDIGAARDGCRSAAASFHPPENGGGDHEEAHARPECAGGAVVRDRRGRGGVRH